MPKITFGIKGVGKELEGGAFETPKPGVYEGKLKRLEYTKTTGGQNPGTPMLKAMVQITGPASAKKYHGAAVWRNIVITDKSAGFVNQFLNALTDGSQSQILRVQKAFWEDGIVVNDEGQITKIGPIKINSPEGERPVLIQVKNREYQGNKQAEIANWLRKSNDDDDDSDSDDSSDDGIEDVSDDAMDDDAMDDDADDDMDNIEVEPLTGDDDDDEPPF